MLALATAARLDQRLREKVNSIIDICSRKIIANRAESREVDYMAVGMFETAFTAEVSKPQWVQADSGSVRRSAAPNQNFGPSNIANTSSGIFETSNKPATSHHLQPRPPP